MDWYGNALELSTKWRETGSLKRGRNRSKDVLPSPQLNYQAEYCSIYFAVNDVWQNRCWEVSNHTFF